MAISEAQKAQIISYSGKMTADEIAKKVGVNRATVFRLLKKHKEGRIPTPIVAEPVAQAEIVPTCDKEERSRIPVANQSQSSVTLSPTMIAEVALDHLISEINLYNEALSQRADADEKTRSLAEWKVINHEKLVQSALRIVAQWFGMDKGDVLKAIEEIRHDPFATMSCEELLALYEVTR